MAIGKPPLDLTSHEGRKWLEKVGRIGSAVLEYIGDGYIRLVGDATVYDDLQGAATTFSKGGVADPDFIQLQDDGAGSTGVYAYAFDKTVDEELFITFQLSHTWKEGSTIHPHIHWAPSNTNTGSVTWKMEYSWADVNEAFPTTSTLSVTDAGDGTALKHQIADLGNITATGKTLSSILSARIYRDVSDGDDYNADAYLLYVDIHYEKDSMGSREEYVK